MLITVGFIVIILVVLFYLVDPQEIWQAIQNANWRWLLAALIGLMAGILMISVRWRFLLQHRSTYRQTLMSDGMSNLTTSLSPIPAPALRVVTISRISPVTITQSTSGMVVDRLLEQIMRVICLLLALISFARLLVSPVALAGNFVFILLGLLALLWIFRRPDTVIHRLAGLGGSIPGVEQKKAHSFATKLVQGFILAGSPGRFLRAFLISLVMWMFFFFFQAAVMLSLGLELGLNEIAAIALTALAVAPPSAPAMPGVYHGILIAGLALLGILDGPTMTAYAILSHALQLVLWLPLGIWGLLRSNMRWNELLSLGGKRQLSRP